MIEEKDLQDAIGPLLDRLDDLEKEIAMLKGEILDNESYINRDPNAAPDRPKEIR